MKESFVFFTCLFLFQTVDGQTFTEKIQIECGDTAYVGGLGYPSWNDPKIIGKPALGHAVLLGDFIAANLLEYTAPLHFSGPDTVVIECAHATQITCDTGIYVFEISCDPILRNDAPAVRPLAIFPNPVSDFVQFGFETEILELEVFNATGQFFSPKMMGENGRAGLAIGHLPTGEYLVFMKSRTGSFVGKFLKNK